MKVGLSWLHSLCESGLDAPALAARLSATGTEVERIGHFGAPSPDGYVIARVLSAEQHPDADRLRVCGVDSGEPEPRTIVCGAANLAAGQTVAVITPGARLPDGTKLGKAKLRGVVSEGMILSESELGLGEGSEGIAVLETDLPPGTPLSELAAISDPVLELEITPNRPDCLSVFGLARELHAITGARLAEEPWAEDALAFGPDAVGDLASVRVEVPELCPRFTARAFCEVVVGPSPLWLKARLLAAGQRPINNVVDITNYAMLLTGQPLHAFDLDKLPGGALVIRRAAAGESVSTLDGNQRPLDPEVVVVCDRDGPAAIAGIMGGQNSEVSARTSRILLEAANWNGPNILKSSGRLGLRSEASSRFEKRLHPDLAMRGQIVASRLLVEICGARLCEGTIDIDAGGFAPQTIDLSARRRRALLGIEIDAATSRNYLERLGFAVEASAQDDAVLRVTVPADRYFDTTREVDLIEEVARIHDLDAHLPATLPACGEAVGGLAVHQRRLRRCEDLLSDLGFNEVISWHFVDPGLSERLGLDGASAIRVHNPLALDQSVMRGSLLGGLLDAASANLARGAERVSLFESGRAFLAELAPDRGGVLAGRFAGRRPSPAREVQRIGALLCGPLGSPRWRGEPPQGDFFTAKGVLESLCTAHGAELSLRPAKPGERPFLHPGRAAEVSIGAVAAGWLGELDPRVAARWDIDRAAGFEIDPTVLFAAAADGHELYRDVTTFPALYEDISVVLGPETAAAELVAAVRAAGGDLLRRAEVFDLYTGEQIGEGGRSLALRLEFRAPDRTLTDAEVAERRDAIVAGLAAIGGSLRG